MSDSTSSFFEVLGLECTFDLNINDLEQAYLDKQRQHHPDRFIGKDPEKHALATRLTATINEAYRTLKPALERGLYLLSMRAAGQNIVPSPSFLSDIMMRRERLEFVQNTDQLRRELQEIQALISKNNQEITHAFQADDDATAGQNLAHLKYLLQLEYLILERLV